MGINIPDLIVNISRVVSTTLMRLEDKSQEEICKIFKCSRRSVMRWVDRYEKDGNVDIHYRKPIVYKVKKITCCVFTTRNEKNYYY